MYTKVDIILWIFLQNIITLPFDYLLETAEYDIFKTAEYEKHIYILSSKEIHYELKYDKLQFYKNMDLYFNSFQEMLIILETFLDDNTLKKNLISKSKILFNIYFIENKLYNLKL